MNARSIILLVLCGFGYIVVQAVLEREVFDRLDRRRARKLAR